MGVSRTGRMYKRLLTAEQIDRVGELWAAGEPAHVICDAVGVTADVLIARRRDQLSHLPTRPRGGGKKSRWPNVTPAEVAQRKAEVRAGWSPVERLNRQAGGWPVGSFVGERWGRAAERLGRDLGGPVDYAGNRRENGAGRNSSRRKGAKPWR